MEHREKLQQMIEACKVLHEGFDEKRKEVREEEEQYRGSVDSGGNCVAAVMTCETLLTGSNKQIFTFLIFLFFSNVVLIL